ncbi:PP2C family protein-serine/threonine phosphatase [Microbacteriaceae bacterium 4G12]
MTGASPGTASHPLQRLSTAAKQGTFLALAATGAVVAAMVPSIAVTEPGFVVAALVLMLAASGWAVSCARVPALAHTGATSAALDFVALALVALGTEGARTLLGAMTITLVVWFASSYGYHYVAYVCGGVALVQLAPLLRTGVLRNDPSELLPALFSILTYGVGGLVINVISRQARERYDQVWDREQESAEDLDRGAAMQQALLPADGSPHEDYEVAGACVPAKSIGGDFYDWYPTSEGFGFTLADAMGKGAGAGLIAATARAVVRSARNEDDPAIALSRTDDCLSTELGGVTSFATLFHARVGMDGRVRYADAGHGLTVLVRSDGSWERLEAGGVPVGLGIAADWSGRELTLGRGDMLVAFSDGVLDMHDGTLAALERIARLARRASSPTALVRSVADLARESMRPDDVTLVAVRRRR